MPIRSLSTTTLVLVTYLSATPARSEHPWASRPDDFRVSLNVVVALEDGPIICSVILKNTSKETLRYSWSMGGGAFCVPVSEWPVRKEPLFRFGSFIGNPGPYTNHLDPGKTRWDTFYLHPRFLSIPAGKVQVHFGWSIGRIETNAKAEWPRDRELKHLFTLEQKQSVEILPATKKNVALAARVLEAMYWEVDERLKDQADYLASYPDSADDFVNAITGCRHKEFVPLLLRAINRLPSARLRERLVGAIYECCPTPEEGFAVLADYLSAEEPASAVEVFGFWAEEESNHDQSKSRLKELAELKKQVFKLPDQAKAAEKAEWTLEWLTGDEEAWKTSKRHRDLRLTNEQFARLLAVKDVWIRVLLYHHFPTRCPAEWVKSLRKEIGQLVHLPQQLSDLLISLDDERFEIREEASAELIRRSSVWAIYLWEIPLQKQTPEVARRLRLVRERVAKPVIPRLWRRTLKCLLSDSKRHSRIFIEDLTPNDACSLLSIATRKAIEEQNAIEKQFRQSP